VGGITVTGVVVGIELRGDGITGAVEVDTIIGMLGAVEEATIGGATGGLVGFEEFESWL
jgi:hypothetical protein